MKKSPLLLAGTFYALTLSTSEAAFASARGNAGGSSDAPFSLFDRFKAFCPADRASVLNFDPNILINENIENEDDGDSTWVTVYRSNNNLPSVFIKDEFINAMRIATTVQTDAASGGVQSSTIDTSSVSGSIEIKSKNKSDTDEQSSASGLRALKPVAIAKLSRSSEFSDQWVVDNLRCSLKKEDTNDACDGRSEHTEALSVCIDELILHHLREGRSFHNTIRTKATLVSGKLLEERGFQQVTELSKDMATHVSSIDDSMEKYADRIVTTVAKNPGARDRALKILSLLGCLDREKELEQLTNEDENDEEDGYDPWASVKQFL